MKTHGMSKVAKALPDEIIAMSEAIERALQAAHETGKTGIAASVLRGGKVVATGENEIHLQSDPTKHAEMVALARASHRLNRTDLSDCTLISTLQPCEMCLAAMRFAGITRVIFGAQQANVDRKYFVFPHLTIEDFHRDGGFDWVGGVCEEQLLDLYVDGKE